MAWASSWCGIMVWKLVREARNGALTPSTNTRLPASALGGEEEKSRTLYTSLGPPLRRVSFNTLRLNILGIRTFVLNDLNGTRATVMYIFCIFFRKTTLCYISPERDLQMPLAFNVYFLFTWKVLQDINLDLLVKCYRV